MLEIEGLHAAYGQRKVLAGISLSVQAGEVLAVVGPNGAGKSTLIRVISGVHPLQAGLVRVNGQDLLHLNTTARARYLAVVPQARELPPAFTVQQTVLLGRTPYLSWLGAAKAADHHHVQVALECTHTQVLSERPVGELSGGEQQRVLLARALAQDTPILLLDEPTTHLDLQHQANLLNLVRSLAAEHSKAVLMVLHDLNLAGLYADRVALMQNGRLRAEGRPEQVLTAETLSQVYNVPVRVITHPDYGTPLVLPDGKFKQALPASPLHS